MKLKRLIVKNFGSFRETRSFELDGELVVIYGSNFSGKTTLVRALYFALCGKTAAHAIPVKKLVTTDERSATAGLIYEHDDATYRIYRSTKGDFKSERLQQQTWQRPADAGSILPKLNPHQWQMSCFLQEDELGNFLGKTSANRREILHSVLGIDALIAVQKTIIQVRRRAKRAEKAARSRQEHLATDAVDECAETLAACRAEVARLENTLTGREEHSGRQRIYAEWQHQHELARQHLQRLTSEYDDLLAGFADPEELTQTLHTVTTRLSEQTSTLREVETLTEQRIELASKSRHIEELLANFQMLHADEVCPTCQQPLSDEHLQHLETTYREQHDALTLSLEQALSQERDARDSAELFKQLTLRETELAQRLGKLELLERELKAVRAQHSSLKATMDAVPGDDGRQAVEQQLDDARSRLRQLEAQDLRFREYRYNLDACASQAQQATRQRLFSEWMADAVEQTLQAVIGASLHTVEHTILTCLQEFGILKDPRNALELEQSQLMPELDGRLFQTLSGSEKAILYLSMKLAIAQLMPGADFVVLDNPTLHLDDLRRQQMADYIQRFTPQKQVIIFTNDHVFADQLGRSTHIELT